MLDLYLKALDLCYFEVGEAFHGLADENVWKRPAPQLLSIGELAGHIAYWEAVRYGGDGEDRSSLRDLSNCRIKSPLLDPRFGYYSTTLAASPTEEQTLMMGDEVLKQLRRIHKEAMDSLKALNPDLASTAPDWSPQSNYGELLTYMAFHTAYHTGQMYSVRHLLGEVPPDN